MRILVIDTELTGLDFVLRCAEAGHDVRWYRVPDKGKPAKAGVGFRGFKVVEDWRASMPWAREGLILTTGNWRFVHELERWRDLGYKVFAPSAASARLEIDRSAGMDAMQAAGLELPPYQVFNSLEEAEAFARKSDRAYVFKPMGDEADKSLTFVASDPAELVGWLDRQIKAGKKLKGRCMLQEKIEDIVAEIGVSAWCGAEGFLPDKWQICFEHKKLLDKERGPATGEMGTVCQYVESDKLAADMLQPLEPVLRTLGHRGDFAIGAMVDKKGRAWPLEFTARCGWPAFYIQTASHRGDPAQWMRDALDGKDSLRVSYDVAIGVVCAIPNFPSDNSPADKVEGNPIGGWAEYREQLHPAFVMQAKGPVWRDGKIVDEPGWQTAGEYVLCATGLGKTVERARGKVYRAVEGIKIPDKIFRSDIGCKVIEALPELHRFGYATEMDP
jgi:phosphoribosylamine---glycine ligase